MSFDLSEHWIAMVPPSGHANPAALSVIFTRETAENYRASGWTVEGPFVPAPMASEGKDA